MLFVIIIILYIQENNQEANMKLSPFTQRKVWQLIKEILGLLWVCDQPQLCQSLTSIC